MVVIRFTYYATEDTYVLPGCIHTRSPFVARQAYVLHFMQLYVRHVQIQYSLDSPAPDISRFLGAKSF